jgi:hypothetical protein
MIDRREARRVLSEKGWVEFGHFEGTATWREVMAFIDVWPDELAEIYYGGSEKRVWKGHECDAAVLRFRLFADRLLSEIFDKAVVSRDILAIRNRVIGEKSEMRVGRWHLDSLRAQIKVFLFLNDVTPANGPLELIPGSHRAGFKALHALDGRLVRPTDFLGQTRRYQRLDDAWVAAVERAAGGSHAFNCGAGTVFVVDTSAIHRARPCLNGERYALTAYYDHI